MTHKHQIHPNPRDSIGLLQTLSKALHHLLHQGLGDKKTSNHRVKSSHRKSRHVGNNVTFMGATYTILNPAKSKEPSLRCQAPSSLGKTTITPLFRCCLANHRTTPCNCFNVFGLQAELVHHIQNRQHGNVGLSAASRSAHLEQFIAFSAKQTERIQKGQLGT